MPEPSESIEETTPAKELANVHEKPMGFLDHLEELRWTIVKVISAFIIAFIVSAIFFDEMKEALRWPLDRGLREHPEGFKAITSTPMAIFSVYIAIPAIGAITASLPFVLFFIAQFVAPALNAREKRLLIPGIAAAVALFLAGAAFSYFLLVPSVIRISVELNEGLGTELYWTIDKYYSMLLWMVVGMGAAFQFPLIIHALVMLGLVTVQKLRAWRRIMVVVCFVIAAIITPTPDPINMTIVALPLWLLYEGAIVAAAIYTRRRVARERMVEAGGE